MCGEPNRNGTGKANVSMIKMSGKENHAGSKVHSEPSRTNGAAASASRPASEQAAVSPSMDPRVFRRIADIVYDRAGIFLKDGKEALVSARLGKRIRALGLSTHREYLDILDADTSGEELVQLLDVISTNVTSFFREQQHFEFLTGVMEKWLKAGQRRFRFWSSACSSGEEPYTLAMTLLEATRGYDRIDMKILGTDISTRILQRSIAGQYLAEKMKGVPLGLRDTYFDREGVNGDTLYRAKQQLKRMTVFKRLNLSTPPFPMQGPMDAVFCRNVMIYFDNPVRKRLLDEIFRLLKPGGYLFVGHAESLTGMVSSFKGVQPSVYVK